MISTKNQRKIIASKFMSNDKFKGQDIKNDQIDDEIMILSE